MSVNVRSTPHTRRRRRNSWLHRCLWLEPFWLLLLAPPLLLTEYFGEPAIRPLLIVALFLFWPLRLKAKESLLPKGLARWLIGFLLLWLPITIWRSPDDQLSWEIAGYIYLAIVTFVALIHWPPLRKDPRWLVMALLLLGIGLAAIGPEVLSVDPDKLLDLYQKSEFQRSDAIGELTINPNILGAALALILTLAVALVLRRTWSTHWWLPMLTVFPILLMGNSLIISQSRSSWLALLLAGLIMLWLFGPKAVGVLAMGVVVIGVVVIAVGAFWLPGALTDGVASLPLNTIIQSAQDSFVRRLDIWRFSIEMVASSPLAGIGLGAYEQAFTTRFPTLPLVGGRLAPPHAHNLWLQLALDLGLPGLLAVVGLLGQLTRQLLDSLATDEDSPRDAMRIGVLGTFVVIFVIGAFDNALWGTKLTFIPWLLFALAHLVSFPQVENARLRRSNNEHI